MMMNENMNNLSIEDCKRFYSMIYFIRIFEKRLLGLFDEGHIGGTLHLCCGQEAVATGVCGLLSKEDVVFSTHRGHGHILAKGGDPVLVLAEIMGKKNGYCRGRGGTQHICATEIGFMGTNGIVGGGLPVATGFANGLKFLNRKGVVVCFFGDGASSQGTFHESLNIASLWNLPILFVCENNHYAMSNPVRKYMSSRSVAAMAKSYRMESVRSDGMDIRNVVSTTRNVLSYINKKKKPALIEFDCYRFEGHSRSDPLSYRTREEEQQWGERDPLSIIQNMKMMKQVDFDSIHKERDNMLVQTEKEVLEMSFGTIEDALHGVYE